MRWKKGQLTGFMKGMNYASRLNEIAFLVMLERAKESEAWKNEGYDSFKEFCKEVSGGASYETINRRQNELKLIGRDMVGLLTNTNLSVDDARMLQHVLITDETNNKRVVDLGEKKIPFDPEHLTEIQLSIDLIREKGKAAEKDARTAERKLSGIDGEHKKSEKLLLKKIEELEKLTAAPETLEKMQEAFLALDKMLDDFDTALRTLVWKTAWIKDDQPAQAKVEAIHTRAEERFRRFREDWYNEFGVKD
jgi:transposase-like protein